MKGVFIFLGICIAVFIGLAATDEVFAATDIRWTQAEAKVSSNEVAPYDNDTFCKTSYREVYVSELRQKQRACLYGGGALNFAMFSQAGSVRAAVLLPYSDDAHLLEGVCSGWNCLYSASEDTLVTQQPVGQFGWGVIAYAHASQRIHKAVGPDLLSSSYRFDTNDPDYVVQNDQGRYLATPAFNLSSSGRWLVMELGGRGTAIVDLTTFSQKQISTSGYEAGGVPTQDMAVSDDGSHVAIAWSNGGFSVIDVTPGCGQSLIGDLSLQAGATRCPASDLGIGLTFPNFRAAHRPHFRGNGEQLDLFVESWVDPSRAVSLIAAGVDTPHKLEVLAIGDSFISGQGETDDAQYMSGTNTGFDTCHTSLRSYPFLVAQVIGASETAVRSVACSGATMGDITGQLSTYWGQGGRLGDKGIGLSVSEKSHNQEIVLGSFQSGRTLQAQFIDHYKPSILLIGVGGNDAGLMGKLRVCAMPGVCEWAAGEGIRKSAKEIMGLYGKLVSMYGDLAVRSPGTRIYAIGYPDVINPTGTCDLMTGVLLGHEERRFMQESLRYLNQVMRAAADSAGITYVDVESSLRPNELCRGALQPAMNGLRLGDDTTVVSSLPLLKIIGSETFHPNPLGHKLIAAAVTQAYPDMGSYSRCEQGAIICPLTMSVPQPPAYWGGVAAGTDARAYVSEFAFRRDTSSTDLAVSVASGSLAPGSVVAIEIRSLPTKLGTMAVDQYGAVQGSVSLPRTIEEGFHTLHLFGMNGAGEPIDMYQFIEIGDQQSAVLAPIQSGGTSGSEAESLVNGGAVRANAPPQLLVPSMPTATIAGLGTIPDTGVLGLARETLPKQKDTATVHSTGDFAKEAGRGVELLGLALVVTGVILLAVVISAGSILHRRWAKSRGRV